MTTDERIHEGVLRETAMKTITIELEAAQAKVNQEQLQDLTLPEWITLVLGVLAAGRMHLDPESWQTVSTMAAPILDASADVSVIEDGSQPKD